MLFVNVDSTERLLYSKQKKNVVSLLLVYVRSEGVQMTWTNLDFIFSGNNLFLSVRLIMFNTGLSQ